VLRGITEYIPGTDFAVRAVMHCREFQGLVWMACFLCTAGMAMAVFLAVGERIYFRGVLGTAGRFLPAAAGRKPRSVLDIRHRAPFVSAWLRDMKILFRDPAFFMNCILTNFLWPVFLWLIVSSDASGSALRMFALLKTARLSGAVYAGAMGVGMVLTAMNAIASTAISREGKHVYVMKIVPVSFGTQILAKAAAAMTMGAVGSLLLLAVAVFLFRLPAELVPGILLMLSIGIGFSGLSGVWLDLHFPKLNWDNSYKSVKQNLNVVIHMLINILLAGLVFGTASHFLTSGATGLPILFAAGVCVDTVLFLVLRSYGARLLERMDV
jgi:ABC-2 type transport system permease protein